MEPRDEFGIADGWWATDGARHDASGATREALRAALGGDDHPDGPPGPGDAAGGAPLWFLRPGDDRSVWAPGVLDLDGGSSLSVADALPADLPVGPHTLRSDSGHVTHVFVLPGTCRRLERSWGWSVQLPQTRSRKSWGHGDLADLAALARWARGQGAAVLAHNPLGASIPVPRQQPSPYYASSRRFWSPLYLRIADVDGAALLGEDLAAAARAGEALSSRSSVDRDAVWVLVSDALRSIWARVGGTDGVRSRLAAIDDDVGLRDHARFCAFAERFGGGRSAFPTAVAHPGGPGVGHLAAELSDEVDRWRWIQILLDDQMAAASRAGAELMADLPVGFDPDGCDAWVDQDLLATGCRIGAPPDDLGPLGQDWGLPPYVPWRLRAAAYRPWIDTLRRVLRHAGMLRIDHVMGLFRLYCIPPGADALDGAYVYSYGSEMLDLACMEAARAGAALLGEDLGTVEGDVRAAIAERGVYGYRVGWFEDAPPQEWPADTVAMMTTHDLPTVAGLWSGADAAARVGAGLPPTPDQDAALRSRLVRLAASGGLDLRRPDPAQGPAAGRGPDGAPGTEAAGSPVVGPIDLPDVAVAAYRGLARAGSDLALATLEDAAGQLARPNLPGTVDEQPNWRVPLPVLIEDLDSTDAPAIAVAMALRQVPS